MLTNLSIRFSFDLPELSFEKIKIKFFPQGIPAINQHILIIDMHLFKYHLYFLS